MKYPKGEIVWVGYHDAGGALRFFLTSKPIRDYYFLYEVGDDGGCTKLGKAKSPPELEIRYKVNERIGMAT